MVGAEQDEVVRVPVEGAGAALVGAADKPVAAAHLCRVVDGRAERLDEEVGVVVLEVEELADAVGGVDGDGGLPLGVALLDAIGTPGVGGLVLGDAGAELHGAADGIHVADAGVGEPDVHHDEAEAASDGGVDAGDRARPQGADAAVHADTVGDGAADHDDGRLRAGGHGEGAQADGGVEDALRHGEHDGHDVGLAAGHHRVGGDLLHGPDAEARLEDADDLVGGPPRRGHERRDFLRRRGRQRQAVAPPGVDEGGVHRLPRAEQVAALVGHLAARELGDVLERRRGGDGLEVSGECLDDGGHRAVDHRPDHAGVFVGEGMRRFGDP